MSNEIPKFNEEEIVPKQDPEQSLGENKAEESGVRNPDWVINISEEEHQRLLKQVREEMAKSPLEKVEPKIQDKDEDWEADESITYDEEKYGPRTRRGPSPEELKEIISKMEQSKKKKWWRFGF